MKQKLLIMVLVFNSFSPLASAADVALGVLFGAPSALSTKIWWNEVKAVDLGLALSLDEYVLVFGDYLTHYPGALGRRIQFTSELTPYMGVGGLIVSTRNQRREDTHYLGRSQGTIGLAVRIPFGLEWRLAAPSIGVFLEVVPGLALVPTTAPFIQGGVGLRYYF